MATIEEDDDDLYNPVDTIPGHERASDAAGDAGMEIENREEEIEEEEEDEDDFNIITEAPEPVTAPPTQPQQPSAFKNEVQRPSLGDSGSIPKTTTPSFPKAEISTSQPAATKPLAPQKPGSSYPAQHTSSIDVSANPIHPATSKPILSTDLDDDFPGEDDKPWRRPGSDISDYFNYGFDEFTWASYCLKQQDLRKEVGDQKKQLQEMQAFLGLAPGGMPGMPGPPQPPPAGVPGPGGGPPQRAGPQNVMPGMPPGMPELSADMMQGMLAGMMAQGLDPSSMDPMTFMQHAQAMLGGGQPGTGTPQAAQPGYGAQPPGQGYGGQPGGQQQMGYGGYDQRGAAFGGGMRGKGIRRW
ncbi:pre-mRNA polyadenylation factor fip1 [Coccidioides immitis RS]|uniref:Pre-mRNA polyadenylation factor fip1 n=3 Tax=Coccidioides immitis TaxID=5501 RepID=J3K2W3_COCIM|nr:pre-mRNA polyadenylation factor fip1 [Coccidioides immitis RS]EAS28468.3 pre-mRNA polyadenylation factor fip1 [Coccidioides immitis RS]KMP02744.1 pre-mRNA polyadenylation factor fip1 [Coccidioides immitis RMSCC 2394]KMU89613.1 pre-mRNA polyadenylation factor fip1 [Coccidioides immitis H538.4]TPX23220.1 cleavage polyadenylation factor subunit fip1 [Coccidioides immitis]